MLPNDRPLMDWHGPRLARFGYLPVLLGDEDGEMGFDPSGFGAGCNGLDLRGHQTLDLGGRRIGRWPMMWVGSAAGEVRDLRKKHYCRVCRWVAC
ncbi:hypothetical protein ACLOJK_040955 [Asimina triloba]